MSSSTSAAAATSSRRSRPRSPSSRRRSSSSGATRPGDDRLVADILQWRSRCYRRQRDWLAAREDVERALELAQSLGDARTLAHSYFQASIIAERNGQWILARSHAERAKALYEQEGDRLSVGRLLNNLGGLNFLLGRSDDAVGLLKQAVSVALEVGSSVDAAQAISSLAQVHLKTGEPARAEEQARHALELLDGRTDFLSEIGNAQLVLGRALLEQSRLDEAEEALGAAEASLAQLGSGSHTAAAGWLRPISRCGAAMNSKPDALSSGGRDLAGRQVLGGEPGMRLRIAIVLAVLAAALLLPGFARAESGQGTSTEVAATVNGFADGNGTPDHRVDRRVLGRQQRRDHRSRGRAPRRRRRRQCRREFGMSDGNG